MAVSPVARLGVVIGVLVLSLWSVSHASSRDGATATGPAALLPLGAVSALAWSPSFADNSSRGDNGGDNSGNGDNVAGDNSDNSGDDHRRHYNDNEQPLPNLPPLSALPTLTPRAPACSTPGEEIVFTSLDGKASVRMFPNMPESYRVKVNVTYDFLSVPPLPGKLVGLLLYDVAVEPCDRRELVQTLPADVNLSIDYDELDIRYSAIDESRIRIGWLDPATNDWQLVEKQSTNEASNAIGASIARTGLYVVYEAP